MKKWKTKIVYNEIARQRARNDVEINEVSEEVEEYRYLGKLFTTVNDMDREIDARITTGRKNFGQHSCFLQDKKIPNCLKKNIFDKIIFPSMTYGAETWSLAKRQENKLAAVQRSMERTILNITRQDKIGNVTIRDRTRVTDIIERIGSMKEQWAGHITLTDNSKRQRSQKNGHL